MAKQATIAKQKTIDSEIWNFAPSALPLNWEAARSASRSSTPPVS